MALKSCIKCDHEISEWASSCPNCGAPQVLSLIDQDGDSTDKRPKTKLTPGLMILCILVAIGTYFFLVRPLAERAAHDFSSNQSLESRLKRTAKSQQEQLPQKTPFAQIKSVEAQENTLYYKVHLNPAIPYVGNERMAEIMAMGFCSEVPVRNLIDDGGVICWHVFSQKKRIGSVCLDTCPASQY